MRRPFQSTSRPSAATMMLRTTISDERGHGEREQCRRQRVE